MISIDRKDVERIRNYLLTIRDEGPVDEGWQSPELEALIEILRVKLINEEA